MVDSQSQFEQVFLVLLPAAASAVVLDGLEAADDVDDTLLGGAAAELEFWNMIMGC